MKNTTYNSTTKVFELKKSNSIFKNQKITCSGDAYNFIKQFYHDDIEIYESFFILLLNNANNTIGYAKISQGGVAATYVDVKIVAKYAIESLATSVILAHNHPSGTLRPSEADKNITKKISEVLGLFDCKVFDHIILTSESYLSFADDRLI